jgi:fructose-bisphosphate aldolase class I
MDTTLLRATVAALLARGKGLLAADESLATIGKRFDALNIAATEQNRCAYRGLLVTTPHLNDDISGVILFDETLRQKVGEELIPGVLSKSGIVPGIKVDRGTSALPGFAGEKFTQGLDGLRDRLLEYFSLGARFTKWRAVFAVGEGLPTSTCIEANAHALAMFAALSQEAGLVPIVEPEVLMDGAHTITGCEFVTMSVLKTVFSTLRQYRVAMDVMLLKVGMVLPGKGCPQQAEPREVADATIRCLRDAVPASVPGIVFLSGGQSSTAATERLNAICCVGNVPWTLSFSFGRALQNEALETWRGCPENIHAAQNALRHRAVCDGLALRGKYSAEAERTPLDS